MSTEDTSPHTPAPRVEMSQVKSKLWADIRAKRALRYEEKLKAYAMYSEEKDLDDKKEEEEILEDEISDESNGEESEDEVDENQEENVETLLDADPQTKKMSRRRCTTTSSTSSTPSSPFPRMNSDSALDAFCEDRTPVKTKIPLEVAKLVGTQESSASDIDDEFEGICSAEFPSQPPSTPSESQEFESFGFGNEDDLIESKEITTPNNVMSTPSMYESSTDVETPKNFERNRIESKRLNFQNVLDVVPIKDHSAADQADDEDDDERNVITTKVQRKRKRVLKFSDDEDSDEEDESMDMDDNAVDERIEQEEVDESDVDSNIEYDEHEEEEIPTFRGLVSGKTGMLRKEFVDAEAELSGDEIGSADEDERELDEFELEACDDADMDEEALRNQVGKAHLKLLLDDDQREIRYLQDMYLEQGDLYSDGKGRERQFKWKNIDNYDAEEPLVNGEEGDVEIVEDETEAKRQKDRLEKIKWIKEHSQTEEIRIETDPDENPQIFLKDSQFLKLTDNTLHKIQSVSSLAAPVDGTTKAVGLSKRGSFLLREPSSISRLAEMTKINDSVAKVKNKLVFTVITPPSDPSKFKSTDPTKKQYRRQPKKILKVDPALVKVGQTKPSATLFKWIK